MNTLEEVIGAIGAACGDCALTEDEADDLTQRVRADARALWSVRVLDAWADNRDEQWSVRTDDGDWFDVVLGFDEEEEYCGGSTPDAARHAAALAVYPSLPVATQAELGECP